MEQFIPTKLQLFASFAGQLLGPKRNFICAVLEKPSRGVGALHQDRQGKESVI